MNIKKYFKIAFVCLGIVLINLPNNYIKAKGIIPYRLQTIQVDVPVHERISLSDGYFIIEGRMTGIAYLNYDRKLQSYDVSFSFKTIDGSIYYAESFKVNNVQYTDNEYGFTAKVDYQYTLMNKKTGSNMGTQYNTITFKF